MGRPTHPLLSVAAAIAMLFLLALSGRAADMPPSALVDQHWTLANSDPQRLIELRVLVVNNTPSPLRYQIRFIAEWAEAATLSVAPARDASGKAPAPAEATQWWPVQIFVAPGGQLASGASETVAETLPADLLQAPKAYRFRAELLDGASGTVLADTFITRKDDQGGAKWLPAAAAAVLVGVAGSHSPHDSPDSFTGSGTMVGTHEAERVGSEWIEHGSGVITITGRGFQMVIDYIYDSHGPNAGALTATGTGVGTITRVGRPPVAVNIASATAEMIGAGDRSQSGTLVTRAHCSATGTFDGLAGDERYRGTITMTNGTQTLDLTTHRGDHRFDIQFNAVR